MQGIKRFLHDYARWIAAALAILFLGLTVYYATAQRFVDSTVSMTRRHDATNLAEGDVIEQMVCFTQEDLELNQAQIQVLVGTYQNNFHTGILTISLLDENGQTVNQISQALFRDFGQCICWARDDELQPDILYTLRIAASLGLRKRWAVGNLDGGIAAWRGTEEEKMRKSKSIANW